MKTQMLAALVVGAIVWAQSGSLQAQPTDNAPEPGFKSLFNGKDLTGWDGHPKLWSVKDGVITGQTTAENPAKNNTFLIWTNGTVSDFELRCSFKLVANNAAGFANSGIQYRSKILDPSYWVMGGYQGDMEAGPTYTGILYEERMTRGIMAQRGEKVLWNKDCKKEVTGSLGNSAELQAAIKKEDWNDYVIIAQGNHLQHFVNGKQTVDVTDDCESKRASTGVLGLQLHAGQPMTAQFKNIRLKELAGTTAAAAAAPGADLKLLQGVWQVASAERNGQPIPADDISAIVVTIKDMSYVAEIGDTTERGSITVDPAKQPKQMDIHPANGPSEGHTLLGIYETTPDGFRVCYAEPDKPRPTAFTTIEDSGCMLMVYKRK